MSNKYMVKVAVVALLALILVFGYFSFVNDGMGEEEEKVEHEQTEEIETERGEEEKIVIGVTLPSDAADYQEELGDYIKNLGIKDEECELNLQYAQWDVEKQQEQMREFIEEEVDAIILCPVNAKSFLNVLRDARNAGIPVINLNMKVDTVSSEYIATYVGSSSSEQAALAAELVIDYFDGGEGKVGIIEGAPGSDPAIYRTQTFLEEVNTYPNIEVVGIICGQWSRNTAGLAAMDLLNRDDEIDLIYCHDSNMAMGAYEMLEEMGMEDEVKVIGVGNSEEYMEAVKDGKLYGIVTQPVDYEAEYAWITAKKAAKGSRLRPWYKNPVEVVTRENVEGYRSPMEVE